MTDLIAAFRRLIFTGAALLVAAAVVIVYGVIPPVMSDTFRLASPGPASGALLIQALVAVLAAIVLAIVAARAAASPRAAVAILRVTGTVVFLLGIAVAGPALAFVSHGPSLRVAVFLMFLSGAAEFAAVALVVVAASRLPEDAPGAAAQERADAWKTRIAPAALLGLGSFFLMFLVGEGVRVPATVPSAEYAGGILTAAVLGAYSLFATWLLARGLPRALGNRWIVLALNAALLLTALGALLVEPNKSAALQVVVAAIVSGASSYGGLVLAGRGSMAAAFPGRA